MTTEQEQLAAANQTILEQQARIEKMECALKTCGIMAGITYCNLPVIKQALATPSDLSALREHEAKHQAQGMEEAAAFCAHIGDDMEAYHKMEGRDAVQKIVIALRRMAAERRG